MVPSRFRSIKDVQFIQKEFRRLESEGIIKKSHSQWRAQVVVAENTSGKKRLCVDYSTTINKFTALDAFPVPHMQSVINQLHGHRFFTTLDLRSAYHQVPLSEADQPFTAFEADGNLWQFTRLPFGVTNGVPVFCRVMKQITTGLEGVVHYFDDVVICGRSRQEHDTNFQKFITRAREVNLTLNLSKCQLYQKKLTFLGHVFEDGIMKPDPARLQPLLEFPTPRNKKRIGTPGGNVGV